MLNLRQYPVWQDSPQRSDPPLPSPTCAHDGLTTLLLPPGNDTIDILYHRTPDQTAGLTLSGLACVIALFVRAKNPKSLP